MKQTKLTERQEALKACFNPAMPPDPKDLLIEELYDRIEQLEILLGTAKGFSNGFRAFEGITKPGVMLMGMLMKRDECAKDDLYMALYGNQMDGGPKPKIVDVHMSRLRMLLAKHDIHITNIHGVGWCLSKHQKDKVKKFLTDFLEREEQSAGYKRTGR